MRFVYALLFLTSHACSLSAQEPARPNIVFFFADDQTSSSLSCYGHQIAQTPNIDALAKRGIRFENSFVSQPICWISRTTILSGLTGRGFASPGDPEQARPDAVEKIYTDHLREAGYRTGFYGKWHAKMPQGWKKEEHFDECEAIDRNPYYKPQPDGSLRHETDLIIDRGISFLKSQPKDQPFALNLWFNACHAEDDDRRSGIGHFPWPRAFDGMYEDVEFPSPVLGDTDSFEALPDYLQTTIARERYFWRWNTPEKYQINMRAYFRMVSGIDGAVGRFLAALEEQGLADNTIIVYSADNGFHMGNRGLAGKWSHYEESIRVPLVIYDPRAEKRAQGQVTSLPALNLDFPATFLDWAGVPIPPHYQGRSLAAIVKGEAPKDWRTETFHEHFAVRNRIPAHEGLRTAEFKYANYFDEAEGTSELLHDLRKDAGELVNLADDPEYASVLKGMRERTAAIANELGEPLPPAPPRIHSTAPHPAASAAVTVKPGADGWVNITPAGNLRGWAGDPRLWSVKDGVVSGTSDGSLKLNHFLTWKGSTVRNFELEADVKITAGGNSGIQYRSKALPEIGLDVVSGYQCDIVADVADYNGMMYEERGRGILGKVGQKIRVGQGGKVEVTETFEVEGVPAEAWHTYRIVVDGSHHQHFINGQLMAEMTDEDPDRSAREGVLAFQLHQGAPMEVQFRKVRIRHLAD